MIILWGFVISKHELNIYIIFFSATLADWAQLAKTNLKCKQVHQQITNKYRYSKHRKVHRKNQYLKMTHIHKLTFSHVSDIQIKHKPLGALHSMTSETTPQGFLFYFFKLLNHSNVLLKCKTSTLAYYENKLGNPRNFNF